MCIICPSGFQCFGHTRRATVKGDKGPEVAGVCESWAQSTCMSVPPRAPPESVRAHRSVTRARDTSLTLLPLSDGCVPPSLLINDGADGSKVQKNTESSQSGSWRACESTVATVRGSCD